MSRYGVQPNMLVLAAAGKLTKSKPILADSRPSPQASRPLAASALGEPEAWNRRTCSHRPTILLFCVRQMLLYMALAPEQKLTCASISNPNLATIRVAA